jgi:hypothetical protein
VEVPRVGGERAVEDFYQCGFAGAVRADEHVDFAAVDVKVYALEHGHSTERLENATAGE